MAIKNIKNSNSIYFVPVYYDKFISNTSAVWDYSKYKKNPKKFSSRESFDHEISELLIEHEVDLIVLAGFMRILSKSFIKEFNKKIINIHPSLLPKYPGLKTHEKVMKNKDKYHGVTIHLVDEGLDSGPIIAQAKFKTSKYRDIDSLIVKIHSVEHKLYPLILKKIVDKEIDLLKLSGKNFKCYEDGFDF